MRVFAGVIAALLVGCGSSGDSGDEVQPGVPLQLLVSAEPIEIQVATTVLVQVLVVGADGLPVSISAADLPSFASLSGAVLTLSPKLADLGEYDLSLTATAGAQQDSATLRLRVTPPTRENTPPMWGPVPMMWDEAKTMPWPTQGAVISGTPYLSLNLHDAEFDSMTLDVEIVPNGQLFTNVPTHSFEYEAPSGVAVVFQPITGLAVGGTYRYQLRVTDALGMVDPYGWVSFGTFSLVP